MIIHWPDELFNVALACKRTEKILRLVQNLLHNQLTCLAVYH